MASREHHLFQIPELLELILAQLPMKDLLLAQRVCRRFNDIIRTSIPLQQALFFRPLPATAIPLPVTPPPSPRRLIPNGVYVCVEPRKQHTLPDSWERNPLLISAFPPWFGRIVSDLEFTYKFFDCGRWNDLPLGARPDAFLRPEASWRRMLVTQPPIFNIGMGRSTTYKTRCEFEVAKLRFPEEVGVTMGAFYDLICQLVLPPQAGEFRAKFDLNRSGTRGQVSILTLNSATDGTKPRSEYFSRAYEELSLDWRS